METVSELKNIFLTGTPILDVRAPVEFQQGCLPNSQNIGIMNDEEREKVGTVYKTQGQQQAIDLGFELVSGAKKEARVQAWKSFFEKHPDGVLTCFRGGLRSRTAQAWLQEIGIQAPRLDGGYKQSRQFFIQTIEEFSKKIPIMVLSGATGSGKSVLLREVQAFERVIDLEKFANHRGSAFGGYANGQPKQINFENNMALAMLGFLQSPSQPVLLEDESKLIGRCVQPDILFEHLRQAPILLLEEPLESRVEITFEDYILNSELTGNDAVQALALKQKYELSLRNISRKLGGLRFQLVETMMKEAFAAQDSGQGLALHKNWIRELLQYYYDPMYLDSLERRKPKILWRGTRQECSVAIRQGLLGTLFKNQDRNS